MAVLGAFPAGLVCRPIHEDDWEGVVECLGRGFPQRHRSHWVRALARMAQRSAIADFPQYGLVLAMEGRIVGVLLALYYSRQGQEGEEIRCNLSSWAVDEEFRPYAGKMVTTALRRKNVTYINVSPAPETIKINEALGFRRYSNGQFAFLPALGSVRQPYRVLEVRPDLPELMMLSDSERGILLEHSALGCRSLICVRDGTAFPFVFMTRRVFHGLIPCGQVIYCRSALALSQCAGAIGRFLLRRGILLCVVDANEPVPGLVGRYFRESGPKYFKGPKPPSLGDLAFTELVIFGS